LASRTDAGRAALRAPRAVGTRARLRPAPAAAAGHGAAWSAGGARRWAPAAPLPRPRACRLALAAARSAGGRARDAAHGLRAARPAVRAAVADEADHRRARRSAPPGHARR